MKKVCFVNAWYLYSVVFTALIFAAGCSMPSTVSAAETVLPSTTVTPARPLATSTPVITPSSTMTSTPTPTNTPSPGCEKPAEDYTRVDLPYATLNMRTYTMLQYADSLYEGPIDLLNAITQGSYTNEVEASFGTHSGGGAVDLSVIDTSTWTVLEKEIEPLIRALRLAGFAAWLRRPDELYPGSPIHIHAVAVGDEELSYTAYAQVYSEFGYLAGMDGLPPAEGEEPSPDPHGGPVICDWMEE